MTIRDLDPDRDGAGVVALIREASPEAVISVASWRHQLESIPARARLRDWTAVDGDEIVGSAYACLNFFSQEQASMLCGITVRGTHRRRGIGAELFSLAHDHARECAAASMLAAFYESEAGVAFARKHAFSEVRAESLAILDPRGVREAPAGGLDIRTVAEVDPQLVYAVDMEATQDMPSTEPIDNVPYDEWEQHVLANPLFTAEGSFVVMEDGRAVAVSLLVADRESGRGLSMFTGTLRGYRGRGLGIAVKLASIAWAAEHGITALVTTNDETNAPMLAINRRLGYRVAGRRVEYRRDFEPQSTNDGV